MGIVDPYRHSRRPDGFLFSSRPPHNAFRHPDLTDRYHRGWMGICHNHRRSYASDLRYRRPRRALYRRSRPMDLQSHSYPANRPEIATPLNARRVPEFVPAPHDYLSAINGREAPGPQRWSDRTNQCRVPNASTCRPSDPSL